MEVRAAEVQILRLGGHFFRLVQGILVGWIVRRKHNSLAAPGQVVCALEVDGGVNRFRTGIDHLQNYFATVIIMRCRGVERLDRAVVNVIDVMDYLAVERTFYSFAADFDADVIPAPSFNPAWLPINCSAVLDAILGVVPAADIPPGAVFVIGDAKQNQESFLAAQFARFERERVIRPRLVPGDGADELLLGGLLQRAVFNVPMAVAKLLPAVRVMGKIGREQNLAVGRGDYNVLELRFRVPRADTNHAGGFSCYFCRR